MSDVVVSVEDLGKQYALPGGDPRDRVTARLTANGGPRAWVQRLRERRPGKFWALRNVSFQLRRGEVVGIIGRNGAGKSTLLKILSRIVAPTTGAAEIRGRVGSLLEVGTGFHPDLTGRENIYLNGAILGMKKAEIDRNFDSIVAFAETEKFLDMPVKHYSSGMYVRLAFAVAAHLEPEIMIVDEVLAVGDVEFQKKCLGKMQDLARGQGRTVLFVSHNMDAVQRLCPRSLLLEGGTLIADCDTQATLVRYITRNSDTAEPDRWIDVSQATHTGTQQSHFVAVRYSSLNENTAFRPYPEGPLEFSLDIVSDAPRFVGSTAVTLYSLTGTSLVNADSLELGRGVCLKSGHNMVRLRIEKLYLKPGTYVVGLWLANPVAGNKSGGEFDSVRSAFQIEVVPREPAGLGSRTEGVVTCAFEVVDGTAASRLIE